MEMIGWEMLLLICHVMPDHLSPPFQFIPLSSFPSPFYLPAGNEKDSRAYARDMPINNIWSFPFPFSFYISFILVPKAFFIR